ncbi:MAG: hypothetical protein ABEJ86_02955 [Halococcoides sp.]
MSVAATLRVLIRHLLGWTDERPLAERARDLEAGDRVIAVADCDPLQGTVTDVRPAGAVVTTDDGPVLLAVESGEVLAIERRPERLRGRVAALDVLEDSK